MAWKELGVTIEFTGHGDEETGRIEHVDQNLFQSIVGAPASIVPGQIIIRVDKQYFRPTEVDMLIGDASKAKEKLNWTPVHDVASLCKEMVHADVKLFQRVAFLKQGGFTISNEHE
jgi:GDPmannose 4,6-dehydratase